MAADERRERQPSGVAGVSMRDLLAAGVAARLISTPPRAPEPEPVRRPKAA
ncbi:MULTISPECIES: hypothetical protein [Streptomyces]|uniref:Uncharacterized protein n=1 Tax=Streptomyces griseiscabiei TaxID=2993540 RepID=A0ABU4LCL6_9ACTN|nr:MULTISPECIES: hypothetical protein [Streptomyces]MBZ3907419.1 hypothetical protein [Streptomyces griseiscabiei]MDX2913512.1 hypothetical protein [Streptomyces griseiscabiei]